MTIKQTQTLPNGMGLSIIELDDPIVIQNFEKRFQIALRINNRNIMPKSKSEFLEFEEDDYLYSLVSEKTNRKILVNQILYFEKQLCDKSLEECTTEILRILSEYNRGQDIDKELRKEFNF